MLMALRLKVKSSKYKQVTDMDKLAVVILNWNGAEMLHRFLPSVVNNSQGEGITVYVADNASTDNSRTVVEKEFPSVRWLQLDWNYGFAEGYNKALSRVEAEYYLLLNSDVEVGTDWLSPLIAYMDAHPDTAACQPKLLSYKNRTKFEYAGACGGYIDRYGYPFCRGRLFDTVETDEGQYNTIAQVFWASGAALMVRSADYWKVNGLDGRFFAHMEEIDFCWRLRNLGRKIVCIPQGVVYHVGGATLSKTNPRKTFLNFRNNLLMLYKNLPEKELKPVLTTRHWLDNIALAKFYLSGNKGDARAVMKARNEFKKMQPQFADSRQLIQETRSDIPIPEIYQGSILAAYYLNGKKTFSSLRHLNK